MKVKWFLMISVSQALVLMVGMTAWCAGQVQSSTVNRPRMQCRDQFVAMDADKDRTVTKQEFLAVPHPHGPDEEMFKARDTDKDEMLTEAELCAGGGFRRGKGRNQ
jgi:hypothetical protein